MPAALTLLGAGDFAGASRWMRRIAHPDNRDNFSPEFGRRPRGAPQRGSRCARSGLQAPASCARRRRGLRGGAAPSTSPTRCKGRCARRLVDHAEQTLGAPWGAWANVATLLRIESGARDHTFRRFYWVGPDDLLTDPARALEGHVPGLERAVYDALAREPDAGLSRRGCASRAPQATSLAAFESVAAGTPTEARALHARATTDLAAATASGDASVLNHLPQRATFLASGAAIELRAGEVERARAALATATFGDGRHVTLAPFLHGDTEGHPLDERYVDDDTIDDWSDLVAGDGAALVTTLTGRRGNPFVSASLAFGVRRLDRGREPLAAWLSWGDRAPCWRCVWRSAVVQAAHTAMTARALRRPDVSAQAERSLAAFRPALLRRDAAVAALLIESM